MDWLNSIGSWLDSLSVSVFGYDFGDQVMASDCFPGGRVGEKEVVKFMAPTVRSALADPYELCEDIQSDQMDGYEVCVKKDDRQLAWCRPSSLSFIARPEKETSITRGRDVRDD